VIFQFSVKVFPLSLRVRFVGVDILETVSAGVADGVGEGAGVGVADGVGEGVGVGVADGVGEGVGVGEGLTIETPLSQTNFFPDLIHVKVMFLYTIFCLYVLHALPGAIFVAEKADNGKREITSARASPL